MSVRPSFAWVAVAVWLRMFLPGLLNYVEVPHTAAMIGIAATRTANSVLAAWVTTVLLAAVCVACLIWPRRDRVRTKPVRVLICILVPLLAFVQAFFIGAQTPIGVLEFVLTALILAAVWATAPTYPEVAVVGYLGAFSVLSSIALAVINPEHAAFVDMWGYTASTKAIIGDAQIAGIFGHSNTLGMVSVLSLAAIFAGRRSWLRHILVAVCLLGVLLSASRTALLTVVVLAVYWAKSKMIRHNRAELSALILIPVIVVVVLPLLSNAPSAFTNRGLIWSGALDAARESWFIGLGSNWFSEVLLNSGALGPEAVSGHNLFVHVLATAGIIGLIVYAAFLGTLGLSIRQAGSDADRALIRRVFVAVFTIGILEFAWSFEPNSDIFLVSWFLVASMVVAGATASKQRLGDAFSGRQGHVVRQYA